MVSTFTSVCENVRRGVDSAQTDDMTAICKCVRNFYDAYFSLSTDEVNEIIHLAKDKGIAMKRSWTSAYQCCVSSERRMRPPLLTKILKIGYLIDHLVSTGNEVAVPTSPPACPALYLILERATADGDIVMFLCNVLIKVHSELNGLSRIGSSPKHGVNIAREVIASSITNNVMLSDIEKIKLKNQVDQVDGKRKLSECYKELQANSRYKRLCVHLLNKGVQDRVSSFLDHKHPS